MTKVAIVPHLWFDGTAAEAIELYKRAIYAPKNAFWGERIAELVDPFGHPWSLATLIESLEPDEIERRKNQFLDGRR